MARIQQSIDIQVPVHNVYNQLTQFEEYPRFMQDVEAVHQLDDTHLHWTTRVSNRNVEWETAITEQVPDRCIAWKNTRVPSTTSRIEVRPVGPEAARVTLTLDLEPEQVADAPASFSADDMAQRLEQDLTRLKKFIESQGSESGAWRGEVHDEKVTRRDRDTRRKVSDGEPARTTQSEASLSQPAGDASEDERFSVAEEVNLDQQSGDVRRMGQMPQETDAAGPAATNSSEAMAESMKQDRNDAKDKKNLKEPVERSVPPSP
jgi:hypothetical protein